MPWTFGNQGKHHETKLAVVEQAPRSACASMVAAPISAFVL
jgi:hypothetical protein